MKLQAFIENQFGKIFWITAGIVFLLVALRAFCIPFSHDEAATFFFYVQTADFLPYRAHIYTNNHVLNSALSTMAYLIAGSHRFVLRLPNLISFIMLCFGIYKHFKYLHKIQSKMILVTFFILTLNFLDFFELCRGYGLSFGFMVLGLAYLTDYFSEKRSIHFILFSLCLQMALAANLIFVVLLCILIFYTLIFQFLHAELKKPGILICQLFNVLLLLFWVKFSFFYKEHGALDYGVGNNYWEVSFKTLMLFIFGTDARWMQLIVMLGFLMIFFSLIRNYVKPPVSIRKLFHPDLFYGKVLVTTILAFYVQKKLVGVNFPEDRTGVFFYILFVLSLSFMVEGIPEKAGKFISWLLFLPTVTCFILQYNLHDFSSWFYHTVPKSVYDTLKKEAEKNHEIITIGGHRVREMDYAFLNYRGHGVLNGMDDAEQMTMNCDYYFAMKREKPYYHYFYDEMAFDSTWDRVLLKRKEKIIRKELVHVSGLPKTFQGNNEYFEFLRINQSLLKTRHCLEAEVEITCNQVAVPLLANVVVQVNNTKGEQVIYKRCPLNWLGDDLRTLPKKIRLTTGPLPADCGDVVVYIWNYKQSKMNFNLDKLSISALSGKGVDVVIPESFYRYLERSSKKPLL